MRQFVQIVVALNLVFTMGGNYLYGMQEKTRYIPVLTVFSAAKVASAKLNIEDLPDRAQDFVEILKAEDPFECAVKRRNVDALFYYIQKKEPSCNRRILYEVLPDEWFEKYLSEPEKEAVKRGDEERVRAILAEETCLNPELAIIAYPNFVPQDLWLSLLKKPVQRRSSDTACLGGAITKLLDVDGFVITPKLMLAIDAFSSSLLATEKSRTSA